MSNPYLRILGLALAIAQPAAAGERPTFVPHQTELFDHPSGQAVAWADFDRDGYPDLAVGFRDRPFALFANKGGEFVDVAPALDLLQMPVDTRSLAWGDYNQDGWPDLYVGFGRDTGVRNKLYRNDRGEFEEVGADVGVDLLGTTRQVSWVDYDNDGDSDLFLAMRDRQSRLLRNDGGTFIDVSLKAGLADPRRTVGAVWFDFDQDGDLDVFLANQSGDTDAMYRNDDGTFVDVAPQLGINRLTPVTGRSLTEGSVGATVCDVNNDGRMDLFVPSYGPDVLYLADGSGGFVESGAELGVRRSALAVSADCGDLDNDGWSDIYLAAYVVGESHGYDAFYWNDGGRFSADFPAELAAFDADHGVRFADFDNDGDLDVALTNRAEGGRLSVLRNELDEPDRRSIAVHVVDTEGNATRQGAEVRIYDSGSGRLVGSALVDTGGGYVSQNTLPTHIGLGTSDVVDIVVTAMSSSGRISKRIEDVRVSRNGRNLTIEI